MRSVTLRVDAKGSGQRLDRFLGDSSELNLTRNKIQRLIEKDLVLVNGAIRAKSSLVAAGDIITLQIPPDEPIKATPEEIPLKVIYEDDSLVVIDKPAGMVTHPAVGNRQGTLVNALLGRYAALAAGSAAERPGIVHRLDKNTSGLLVVARNDRAYLALQQAIGRRAVRREYQAIICGHIREESGTIDAPVGRSHRNRKVMAVDGQGARPAQTDYLIVERYRTYDLAEIRLLTGRTHQIRVHFASLGHPVLGDAEYGGREKWHRGIYAPERPIARELLQLLNRQALHARRLVFDHPVTGQRLEFESEPPDDFRLALEILRTRGA